MKHKIILPLVATAVPVLLSGCATDAHYVQTGDKEQVISLNQINIQDYANAANDAVKKLLASGEIDKVPNPPAIIAISRIVNDTSQQIDLSLITKKIRIALKESGKARTDTTIGIGGTAEDPLAKGAKEEGEFFSDQQRTRLPDFTLSGKIIQTIDRAGDTRRSTYSFQLSLTDKTGIAVWEGESEIAKQGTRATVGF
ncbi:MAG TPA: penicillin-binding protein activator LpoB [Verrucomicrobiae bacterium]